MVVINLFILFIAASPTTTATSRLFDNVPQFEPVSPDEGDRTPVIDESMYNNHTVQIKTVS